MSLHDIVKSRKNGLADRVRANSKVLTLDIETSPAIVYTFDMRPNWIAPQKIIEPSRMLSFAAKWYDKEKVEFYSEHHSSHEDMVEKAWNMLDECEVLVTFNGVKFDVKHLKREFVLAGYPMPKPWKNVDLCREARKQWAFESNSLNHLADRFDLGEKEKHEGFDLWKLCLSGDSSAWDRMKSYNIQDVVLTEKVYDRFRGWLPNHPHLGVIDADGVGILCNQCGSDNLEANGLKRAVVLDNRLYRCKDCGANVQGTWQARAAITRGAS